MAHWRWCHVIIWMSSIHNSSDPTVVLTGVSCVLVHLLQDCFFFLPTDKSTHWWAPVSRWETSAINIHSKHILCHFEECQFLLQIHYTFCFHEFLFHMVNVSRLHVLPGIGNLVECISLRAVNCMRFYFQLYACNRLIWTVLFCLLLFRHSTFWTGVNWKQGQT